MSTPFQKYRCRACGAEFLARPGLPESHSRPFPQCPRCGSTDTRRVLGPGGPPPTPYDRGAGGCCSAGPHE